AADPQLSERGSSIYALDRMTFEGHLKALDAAGVRSPQTWEEVAAAPSADERRAVLTFDDGHQTNLEVALPLLEQYRRRAIFFITTDWIGTKGFMDIAGLRRLHATGMMLGSHGCSHTLFSEMTIPELRREMSDCKKKLEDILGAAVPALAQPGGRGHAA